ncbi:von Willebrand factor type A domain protein, partial [Teladorsagia circumcincta]
GKPLGKDGSPLPTDASGNYVTVPLEEAVSKQLPTDESGNVIYPVTKPDGSPLPTDTSGRYVTDEGTIIEKDRSGRPLGPDGQVLPTDESGYYIYPAVGPDGSPLPTDMHRRPIYPIVTKDGSPLPTDDSGAYISPDGRPIPTDSSGRPLGDDGSPLPTNAYNSYVFESLEQGIGKSLPTDESGSVIYPVTKPDGLPESAVSEGFTVPTLASGRPVPYVAVSEDGKPLPTDQYGSALGENGMPLPTDDIGRPLDHTNKPFPTNTYGEYVVPPSRRHSAHCLVSSHIELIVVLDTSNTVKVLDYRVMKELLKSFLTDHFDLTRDKVRVAIVKYGETAEVPVSLGDYDYADDLLHRISEAKRVKGKPLLGSALKEVAGEILISGTDEVPKFVLLFKNGVSSDDFHEEVEALKSDIGAELFVVEAGDDASFEQDTQITSKDKIIRIPRWRGTDSEVLGPIADAICKADVIIMLDSSENFSPEEFDKMKESVAELVDAGFDLSPDVARIGFVVYSDKVAVPVALGHYEDNIDLIQQISDTEKINDGVAIALYGLNAARQQFQLHGRENATRIVIMITNGRNRGNAAPAAEDLRNIYNVQLFILAVAADAEGLATLKRIAGSEYPDRVYEVATAYELDDQAATISRHLCAYTTPAHGITPTETPFRRTTKRDVSAASYTPYPWGGPRAVKFPPLCSDGIKRPYQFNILVDVTARSSPEDFRLALDHLSLFFQKRFAPDDNMLLFNIMTVNSKKVLDARASLMVGEVSYSLNDIAQNIDQALPSAEFAASDFGHSIIGLSIRKPSTDLLTKMTGSGTRVIHLDWTSPNELFNSWFAYSICDYVTATTTKTSAPTTKGKSTHARKTTTAPVALSVPTNVEAVPLSPTSFSVSWTCCTNRKAVR